MAVPEPHSAFTTLKIYPVGFTACAPAPSNTDIPFPTCQALCNIHNPKAATCLRRYGPKEAIIRGLGTWRSSRLGTLPFFTLLGLNLLNLTLSPIFCAK